jgi:adenosine deaminase
MKKDYKSIEELRQDVSIVTPMRDLEEVLRRLDVFQHAFVSVDAVREITLASILHCFQEESICQVEFRFSPEYMAEPSGLDWDAMMSAMVEAKQACESLLGRDRLKVGFIAIASRNYGRSSALQTMNFAKRWRDHIVGFDLAASEDHFHPEEFLPAVNMARDLGMGITIHSGEGTTSNHIEHVVDLYRPNRIGHATTLINDERLMQKVKDLNICVEACPTSNIITNCVSSYQQHPIMKYLKFGIPVTVNTDDPMLFDTNLRLEWLHLMDHLDATPSDLIALNEHAYAHSFIKDE